MAFLFSNLYVKDLEESIQFYQQVVGLPLVRRFSPTPHMAIAFLGTGEGQIELIQDSQRQTTLAGPDISWGFAVHDLEEKLALVQQRGVQVLSPILEPMPGVRFFFIQDPNGMRVQLVESK